jgi:acyl carrier protein
MEERMDIAAKVKEIIIDKLGSDEAEIQPNARFIEDLGADSLDSVELIMKFEEEFDIEIPDTDSERIKSVQDAIDYISKALN